MILRALSEELGQTLPYDNLEEIRFRMGELAPHLLKYDYIENSVFGDLSINPIQTKQKVNSNLIVDKIDVNTILFRIFTKLMQLVEIV